MPTLTVFSIPKPEIFPWPHKPHGEAPKKKDLEEGAEAELLQAENRALGGGEHGS